MIYIYIIYRYNIVCTYAFLMQYISCKDMYSGVTLDEIDNTIKNATFWQYVSIVVDVCEEAEHVGSWAEECPCHSDRGLLSESFQKGVRARKAKLRKTEKPRGFMSEEDCPYKGCRAVEFASGAAIESLRSKMLSNRDKISAHLALFDSSQRAEVLSDWQQARSRLWSF